MKFNAQSTVLFLFLIACLLGIASSLVGCGNGELSYRQDEKALLRLTVQDLLELEQKKDYGAIYENYGSRAFQRHLTRDAFLKMTNCLEGVLGEAVENDLNKREFVRKRVNNRLYDTITVRVLRANSNVDEQLTFVHDGLDYKLDSVYWDTGRNAFNMCIQNITRGGGLPPKKD